jgi:hypothetical protein
MPHHVFLSYSRKDSDVMARIRDDFHASGLSVWTDQGIEPGTASWKRAIEEAILDAGSLVCILSPDAAESTWVRAELDFAELQGKPVFLILARGDERRSIPFGFASFQWIDIRQEARYSSGIQLLITTLNKHVENRKEVDNFSYRPTIMSILPAPFEWCDVPAGTIVLADARNYTTPGTIGGRFDVPVFRIAKYPITNAQFQAFLDASDGYASRRCWEYSKQAIEWHTQNPQPQATTFPGDDLPRTNVTWYEAVAFCQWLSYRTGDQISLPTERQWQRAAQGDENYLYPWGNQFDSERCSCNRNSTLPVTYFPDGASVYGVMDMSGNVWEWCVDNWQTGAADLSGKDIRSLRGGSYYDELHLLMVNHRKGGYPQDGDYFRGFRLISQV